MFKIKIKVLPDASAWSSSDSEDSLRRCQGHTDSPQTQGSVLRPLKKYLPDFFDILCSDTQNYAENPASLEQFHRVIWEAGFWASPVWSKTLLFFIIIFDDFFFFARDVTY